MPTPRQIRRAEGTIASATKGRRSWDPEVLRNAARLALDGTPAASIPGRPLDAREFQAFARAVLAAGKPV